MPITVTYRLESSDLSGTLVSTDVVDGHSHIGPQSQVGEDGNVLEGSVAGPEVGVGSPVVGEVLGVCASRAGRLAGRVVVKCHGGVEGVSSNNLMHVRGRQLARVHEGVDSVVGELRATESHQLLGGGRGREGGDEGLEHHLGNTELATGERGIDLKVKRRKRMTLSDSWSASRRDTKREKKEGRNGGRKRWARSGVALSYTTPSQSPNPSPALHPPSLRTLKPWALIAPFIPQQY